MSNDLDERQKYYTWSGAVQALPVSLQPDVYWLDLSQVTINPYLNLLFGKDNRMKHRSGRWEIDLRASTTCRDLLLEHNRTTTSVLRISPVVLDTLQSNVKYIHDVTI